jgi:hypothetical protein
MGSRVLLPNQGLTYYTSSIPQLELKTEPGFVGFPAGGMEAEDGRRLLSA